MKRQQLSSHQDGRTTINYPEDDDQPTHRKTAEGLVQVSKTHTSSANGRPMTPPPPPGLSEEAVAKWNSLNGQIHALLKKQQEAQQRSQSQSSSVAGRNKCANPPLPRQSSSEAGLSVVPSQLPELPPTPATQLPSKDAHSTATCAPPPKTEESYSQPVNSAPAALPPPHVEPNNDADTDAIQLLPPPVEPGDDADTDRVQLLPPPVGQETWLTKSITPESNAEWYAQSNSAQPNYESLRVHSAQEERTPPLWMTDQLQLNFRTEIVSQAQETVLENAWSSGMIHNPQNHTYVGYLTSMTAEEVAKWCKERDRDPREETLKNAQVQVLENAYSCGMMNDPRAYVEIARLTCLTIQQIQQWTQQREDMDKEMTEAPKHEEAQDDDSVPLQHAQLTVLENAWMNGLMKDRKNYNDVALLTNLSVEQIEHWVEQRTAGMAVSHHGHGGSHERWEHDYRDPRVSPGCPPLVHDQSPYPSQIDQISPAQDAMLLNAWDAGILRDPEHYHLLADLVGTTVPLSVHGMVPLKDALNRDRSGDSLAAAQTLATN